MKKTNKCELCGKRYKYPEYNIEGEIREKICFTCEIARGLVEATEGALVTQYGERYLNFLEDYLSWREEK
jgi:hypothetical protein